MLGKWEIDALQDVSGDAMTVSGATVTVRAESTGNLATLYEDEAGAIPFATNPFTVAGTTIAFYASPLDRYRIDIVSGAFTRTLRHEAVSMAAMEGISNLPVASALGGTEEFAVVQTTTKKSTIAAIINYLLGLGNTFTPVQHFAAGIGPHYLQNLGLTASVSAKALTISLKTNALANASATDPVGIAFRNATATTGDYVVRSVTAATSIVIPSGGTLGFTAAEDGLIYVYAIDNAGAVELAVAKKALFDESITHNTTAIGTGSDSDNVLYSTTARTGVAVRLIARIRIATGAVAGEWDNAATRVEPWTPSMKKTGDIVQTVHYQDGSLITTATAIPKDDTIPQNTEGAEIITGSITPTSSINKLHVSAKTFGANTVAGSIAIALFRDTTANAIAAMQMGTSGTAQYLVSGTIEHQEAAGSTSSTTFKLRGGPEAANTTYFNGASAARNFGGVANTTMTIMEIQA